MLEALRLSAYYTDNYYNIDTGPAALGNNINIIIIIIMTFNAITLIVIAILNILKNTRPNTPVFICV